MLPSTKALLYDVFTHAFGLRCSFLWLLSKATHSFACKTNKIVTGVLQSIETITHTWSVSTLSQSALFKPKMISYHMIVLEWHVETHCQMILMIGISYHRLVFTVNTTVLLCVFNLWHNTQNKMIRPHRNKFKKPGMRQPVAGVHLV